METARETKRVRIANGNNPPKPKLPEFDEIFAETFLTNMLVLYPLLGIRAFVTPTRARAPLAGEPFSPENFPIEVSLTYKGVVVARARTTPDGGLTLLKGSKIAKEFADYSGPVVVRSQKHLSETQSLSEVGSEWRGLLTDFEVASPSTAAALVTGKSVNGRTAWKTESGLPLGDALEKRNKA